MTGEQAMTHHVLAKNPNLWPSTLGHDLALTKEKIGTGTLSHWKCQCFNRSCICIGPTPEIHTVLRLGRMAAHFAEHTSVCLRNPVIAPGPKCHGIHSVLLPTHVSGVNYRIKKTQIVQRVGQAATRQKC